MKTLFLAAIAMLAAIPAAAHRSGSNATARARRASIWASRPKRCPPMATPEWHHLQKPQLIGATGTLTRRANHIEAAVSGGGDLRVRDDAVFAPWRAGEAKQGAIFYAPRAGRTETGHALDLELVPVAANGERSHCCSAASRSPMPSCRSSRPIAGRSSSPPMARDRSPCPGWVPAAIR